MGSTLPCVAFSSRFVWTCRSGVWFSVYDKVIYAIKLMGKDTWLTLPPCFKGKLMTWSQCMCIMLAYLMFMPRWLVLKCPYIHFIIVDVSYLTFINYYLKISLGKKKFSRSQISAIRCVNIYNYNSLILQIVDAECWLYWDRGTERTFCVLGLQHNDGVG